MSPKTIALMKRGDDAIAEARRLQWEREVIRESHGQRRERAKAVRLEFESAFAVWLQGLHDRVENAGNDLGVARKRGERGRSGRAAGRGRIAGSP